MGLAHTYVKTPPTLMLPRHGVSGVQYNLEPTAPSEPAYYMYPRLPHANVDVVSQTKVFWAFTSNSRSNWTGKKKKIGKAVTR